MRTDTQLDRYAILSLIARGCITPREAERLLALWQDDDAILKIAVCFAVIWVVLPQVHELVVGVTHTVAVALPRILDLAQGLLTVLTQWRGGLQ